MVRSILSAELYVFTNAFNAATVIIIIHGQALNMKVTIRMVIDSKQIFDVMNLGKRPTEKRLAIYIATARDAYEIFNIARVGC